MNESEPVEDSEFVYRRIHRSFLDPALPIPIRRAAFRPSQNDTNGLSVFRARFLRPVETLANIDPAKAKNYYVAQLSVQKLLQLGLTVVPDPIPGGPLGHAVIPELGWQSYQKQKEHWKQVLVELAKLASADIVYQAP